MDAVLNKDDDQIQKDSQPDAHQPMAQPNPNSLSAAPNASPNATGAPDATVGAAPGAGGAASPFVFPFQMDPTMWSYLLHQHLQMSREAIENPEGIHKTRRPYVRTGLYKKDSNGKFVHPASERANSRKERVKRLEQQPPPVQPTVMGLSLDPSMFGMAGVSSADQSGLTGNPYGGGPLGSGPTTTIPTTKPPLLPDEKGDTARTPLGFPVTTGLATRPPPQLGDQTHPADSAGEHKDDGSPKTPPGGVEPAGFPSESSPGDASKLGTTPGTVPGGPFLPWGLFGSPFPNPMQSPAKNPALAAERRPPPPTEHYPAYPPSQKREEPPQTKPDYAHAMNPTVDQFGVVSGMDMHAAQAAAAQAAAVAGGLVGGPAMAPLQMPPGALHHDDDVSDDDDDPSKKIGQPFKWLELSDALTSFSWMERSTLLELSQQLGSEEYATLGANFFLSHAYGFGLKTRKDFVTLLASLNGDIDPKFSARMTPEDYSDMNEQSNKRKPMYQSMSTSGKDKDDEGYTRPYIGRGGTGGIYYAVRRDAGNNNNTQNSGSAYAPPESTQPLSTTTPYTAPPQTVAVSLPIPTATMPDMTQQQQQDPSKAGEGGNKDDEENQIQPLYNLEALLQRARDIMTRFSANKNSGVYPGAPRKDKVAEGAWIWIQLLERWASKKRNLEREKDSRKRAKRRRHNSMAAAAALAVPTQGGLPAPMGPGISYGAATGAQLALQAGLGAGLSYQTAAVPHDHHEEEMDDGSGQMGKPGICAIVRRGSCLTSALKKV